MRSARLTSLLLAIAAVQTACNQDLKAFRATEAPHETGGGHPFEPPPPIEQPPALAKIEPARWEEARAGSRPWTEYAYAQLDDAGAEMIDAVPVDIADFCPNYPNLTRAERKNFWVYLLSSITQFESAFDPSVRYTENFTDSSGNNVVSRGLLQLSIESARSYGCVLASAEELHDPFKNLLCGIRILNRWVSRDGVIRANDGAWKGGARYWSVLRRDNQFNSITSWTKSQAYCTAR